MPTNSPILPFLVLTMAGGCGVSNLMKRAGNNSWVCVQTGLEGGGREREVMRGEGRLSQDTGVLVKTRARERERELHWPQQRAQNGCQSKLQKKKRLSERESLPSLRSGWLVWAHARSLRGRPDSNQLGRAGMGSRVELWVSEAPQFVTAGFEGWTGGGARVHDKCDNKSHWILNRLLISSCFHPSVLALSVWLGERIRTGLPEERMWAAVCLFKHKDERKAGLRLTEVWPPWLEKKLL